MAVGDNTACDAGGVGDRAPGGAAEALAGSPSIGADTETANLACAVGIDAVGPNGAAVGANGGTAGPVSGKVGA